MKKQVSKIKYLLLIVVAMLMVVFLTPTTTVLAESTQTDNVKVGSKSVAILDSGDSVVGGVTTSNVPPTNLGAPVLNDETGVNDVYLYQYLLQAYNQTYGLTDKTHQTETTEDDPEIQLYVEMFKYFTELTLTGTNYLIESLQGLKVLNLENLKVLNIGKNRIASIDVEDLKHLTSLEELILFDNELTEITIPSGLINLKVVNLNKNKLSSFDASLINAGEVYLSFNRFTTINSITLPRVIYNTDLYIELFNNNIVDADESYLAGTNAGAKIKFELGAQGYGLNSKANEQGVVIPSIAKSSKIKFYNSTKYPNLQVNIYNNLTSNLVLEMANSSENKISEYSLEVGEYAVEYVNAETGDALYDWQDEFLCAFKNQTAFKVVPTAPVVKFIIKGKEYDNYGKFSGVGKIVATTSDVGGEMYYCFSGGEWIKGSEVSLKRGGQYSVSFKYVVTNAESDTVYESEMVTKFVSQSVNPYIPDIVIVVLVIALMLVLFFVVLPLLVKYVINR